MFYYLKKKFNNTNNIYNIGLSLLYAYSGYFTAYYWNIMWLDGMLFLPLIVLGIENIVEFIRVVEDLEEDNINEGKPTMLLAEFLDLLATLDENSSKTNDCLKLMSAHASKGLEFNNVFICGLEEGTFPSVFNNFGNTTSEIFFEERRLFFVALTRAKSQLYLSASRNISKDPNDNEASISRFVYEIQNTITMT